MGWLKWVEEIAYNYTPLSDISADVNSSGQIFNRRRHLMTFS
jgi:hypothetical protein